MRIQEPVLLPRNSRASWHGQFVLLYNGTRVSITRRQREWRGRNALDNVVPYRLFDTNFAL